MWQGSSVRTALPHVTSAQRHCCCDRWWSSQWVESPVQTPSLSLSLSLCLCACLLCCVSSSILLFYSGFVYRRRRRYSCGNAAHRRSLNCRAARPSPGLLRSRYRCALYAVNRGHPVINYSAVDHQPYLTRPRPPRWLTPLNYHRPLSTERFTSDHSPCLTWSCCCLFPVQFVSIVRF